jgi:hypothetical protein
MLLNKLSNNGLLWHRRLEGTDMAAGVILLAKIVGSCFSSVHQLYSSYGPFWHAPLYIACCFLSVTVSTITVSCHKTAHCVLQAFCEEWYFWCFCHVNSKPCTEIHTVWLSVTTLTCLYVLPGDEPKYSPVPQDHVQPCATRPQTACTNILEETFATPFKAQETFFNKLHDVSIQKAVLLTNVQTQMTNTKSIIDTTKTCCCQLQQAARNWQQYLTVCITVG